MVPYSLDPIQSIHVQCEQESNPLYLDGREEYGDCPFCHSVGFFRFIQDFNSSQLYGFCLKCNFSGDLVDIYSKVTGISYDESWAAFEKHLNAKRYCECTPKTYLRRRASHYRLYDEFHKNTETHLTLLKHTNLLKILQKQGVPTDVPVERIKGMIRLVPKEFGANWVELSVDNEVAESLQRIESTHLLLMPFYSHPHQINAIWCGGAAEVDRLSSRSKILNPMSQKYRKNFGFAYHPDTFKGLHQYEEHLIYTSNMWYFLQLQLGRLTVSDDPLPMALWKKRQPHKHDGSLFWELMPGEPILWTPNRSVIDLRQAAQVDGLISQYGPTSTQPWDIRKSLYSRPPQLTVDNIRDSATPWVTVVEKRVHTLLKEKADQRVIKFLRDLNLSKRNTNKLLDTMSGRLRRKTINLMYRKLSPRITLNGFNVQSEDDHIIGWKRGEVTEISNFNFCIDRVTVNDIRGSYKSSMLHGSLRSQGKVVPLTFPIGDISENPYDFFQQSLLKHGMGVGIVPVKWRRDLDTIFLGLSNPKVVREDSRVGWSTSAPVFQLPHFRFERGHPCSKPMAYENAPGRQLHTHHLDPWTEDEKEIFQHHTKEESQHCFNFCGMLACQTLYPALKIAPMDILLSGDGAQDLLDVVHDGLDLRPYTFGARMSSKEIGNKVLEHDWPLLIDRKQPTAKLAGQIHIPYARGRYLLASRGKLSHSFWRKRGWYHYPVETFDYRPYWSDIARKIFCRVFYGLCLTTDRLTRYRHRLWPWLMYTLVSLWQEAGLAGFARKRPFQEPINYSSRVQDLPFHFHL